MEVAGMGVLPQISIEEMVPVEQILRTTPERFLSNCIKFGNSGFRIMVNNKGNNTFDYTPENQSIAIKCKDAKYASMLSASLLELHTLLNNPNKINELGFGNSSLDKISALTNKVFIDGLVRLFSKSYVKDIVTNNDSNITIDLQRFKNLSELDPLVKYLARVSERSKGMKVVYFESNRKIPQ